MALTDEPPSMDNTAAIVGAAELEGGSRRVAKIGPDDPRRR